MCKRATAKFGRVSSRPTQKLGVDLGIAIVPCEALSKGGPRNEKNHLRSLVGGNEQMVGENAIAFSCSEAGKFHLAAGSDFFGPQELLCSLWSRQKASRDLKSEVIRGYLEGRRLAEIAKPEVPLDAVSFLRQLPVWGLCVKELSLLAREWGYSPRDREYRSF